MSRSGPGVDSIVRGNPRLFAVAKRAKRALLARQPTHTLLRRRLAMSYFRDRLRMVRRWAPQWTEDDNFYYDLTQRNRDDLAFLLAAVLDVQPDEVARYIDELNADDALRTHLLDGLVQDPTLRDVRIGYGRRLGWYAAVRVLKPRVVVETGVHHGVGACILTAALLRNRDEGAEGRYYGTDIDPTAGRLLRGRYAECGEILYGDSIESLMALDVSIDLFINDSDHSADYEGREYAVVADSLSQRSLVLGDNSHVTDELRRFARGRERPFVFFREDPADHWYPGGGIGISPSTVPLPPWQTAVADRPS